MQLFSTCFALKMTKSENPPLLASIRMSQKNFKKLKIILPYWYGSRESKSCLGLITYLEYHKSRNIFMTQGTNIVILGVIWM